MRSLDAARSFLFAPASDGEKLRKALSMGADAVIADLEDAVAPAEKERARQLLRELLQEPEASCLRLARVNGMASGELDRDLDALAGAALDGIVLAKATPEAVELLGGGGPPLVALVETAAGLASVRELAACRRVAALMLGPLDLSVELRLESRLDGQELLLARSQLVLASALAGSRGPIDGAAVVPRDLELLEREGRLARSLGFTGKACIHPSQIEPVNRVFAPSEQELVRARRIVAAYEQHLRDGQGAFLLDGALVDLPVVRWAQAVLASDSS